MSAGASPARLAVDIGGTFTDIVLAIGERLFISKVLTTPRAPQTAVIEGTRAALAKAGLAFGEIDLIVHGTTLATNAIIERKGARTALIATEGFRDVIEIADEGRFDQYDINILKPVPLVPRELRFTVPERIDVHGAVRLPLEARAVVRLAERLRAAGVEAVAVALIHAYANPAHEQRIGELLAELCPEVSVTLSSAVCPEAREYERTSTAIANAYVQPLMSGYLKRLADALVELGYRRPIHLMTSGGSLAGLDTAARFPVRLIESGPAGGAILAGRIALERGETRILSFDMGGTTAKICLIDNGEPLKARAFEIDRRSRFKKGSGTPLRIPVIEMVEIGAGGGSIARVDELNRVAVGPQSAGSEPGPACYRRGGEQPTVTDADVTLGMIDVDAFAGGTIALDPARSHAALERDVGAPLGLGAHMAAYAVHEMVCENMASAARVHAVERGEVVGEHALIAFGGAAPLHAARVAEKIGVARVIVPPDAGVGSAIGFLTAPVSYELVKSRHIRLDRFDPAAVSALLTDMSREAHALVEPGARGAPVSERRLAYMRYVGQGHEITVPVPLRTLAADDAAGLRTAFEREYAAQFQRFNPGAAIEVLSWSVLVSTQAPRPAPVKPVRAKEAPRPDGTRAVFDGRTGRAVEVPLYRRALLEPGVQVRGPAVIAEDATSTFVSASFVARIDAAGCIILDRIRT